MKFPMDVPQAVPGNVRVNLRSADACVAKQFLDDAQIRAVFQQVRGETVTQHVRADIPPNARPSRPILDALP